MTVSESFEQWAIVGGWRPVVDYEGIYDVSSCGAVRRIGRAARSGAGRGGGVRIGRILKAHEVKGGYLSVQLWRNGKPAMKLVHCLVAAAFIGPCPAGQEVNHKNGNKHHNYASNLEYLTRPDNLRHAYRTGLRQVTVEQMVAVRRKSRVTISCACGCGIPLITPDSKGRDRRYIAGHYMRRSA
jgi:hypothetical protein